MQQLGRYELLAELGRGAMGVVYKARDPKIDRLVAIKVLVPAAGLDAAQEQQRRDRFQREARAAGRLTHPNIVTIHDVGEDQGRAFLVMEFIEGESLEQILRQRRTLPPDQVVSIGEQVALALDHAHSHGIVHRDVKPANILLTRDGAIKVSDFGIARFTEDEAAQTGHIPGTPSYMSPEQVAGLPVDGRSDIFALGAVLYELLTGERAFPGETLNTILYRIVHEDPSPLRRLSPALPANLEACLQKAMAKNPGDRHARASEMAQDLHAAAAGVFPHATAETATITIARPRWAAASRWMRVPRWLWLATGSAAALGIGVVLALWLHSPQAPLEAPPPRAPQLAPAARDQEAAGETARQKIAEEEAPPRFPATGPNQDRAGETAEMVRIPAGTFIMGDTHGDGEDDERPAGRLTLPAFWIDRTEVTNAQFSRFVQTGGYRPQGEWQEAAAGKDPHPVVYVTWQDALAYCRRAGMRLPTEAEWEYAARGADGRKYPWGDQWDDGRARFSGNRGNQTTAPVGSYPMGASPFGVLDMAGNVWEWMSSLYRSYAYNPTDGRENLNAHGRRVVRGGSWLLNPWDLRAAHRDWAEPDYRSPYIGFRCAKS